MTATRIILATSLVLTLAGLAPPTQAKSYTSLHLHAPGFNLYIGKYPRYYYNPYYYGTYNYGPYYRNYYYHQPYTYKRRYRRSYRSNRCGRWSRRCAANWGYGNHNYYGCMRYHRCR